MFENRLSKLTILLLLFVVGCGTSACSTGSRRAERVPTELINQVTDDMTSIRGERNCELFELGIEDDNFILIVWNNASMGHDCPDDWLAQIDRNAYYVDGPRWRTLDLQLAVDDNRTLVSSDNPLDMNSEAVIREVPEGLGLNMFLAAKVTLAPVSRVEENVGVTINSLDDVPDNLRLGLMSGRASQDAGGYIIKEVDRQQSTFWVYRAGNPVYLLSDGECAYAMKYYTSAINPDLTNVEAIADLNNRFQNLPEGFTFEVRTFAEDRYIADLDRKQHVLADEFGNSYDRFACGNDMP